MDRKWIQPLSVCGLLALSAAGMGQGTGKVALEGDEARRKLLAEIQGKPAPNLEIKEWFNGKAVKLSDLKGKVIVLDFWGTWCGPCRAAIPHTNEMQKNYAKDGLVVIGVHTPNSAENLKGFIKDNNMNYLVALDNSKDGRKGFTIEKYHVDSFPDYYLIDRKGILRYADCANASVDDAVKELLAEKK